MSSGFEQMLLSKIPTNKLSNNINEINELSLDQKLEQWWLPVSKSLPLFFDLSVSHESAIVFSQ